MRTAVYPDADDPDVTDVWLDCHGSVGEDGSLAIIYFDTSDIETVYEPTGWASFETTNGVV